MIGTMKNIHRLWWFHWGSQRRFSRRSQPGNTGTAALPACAKARDLLVSVCFSLVWKGSGSSHCPVSHEHPTHYHVQRCVAPVPPQHTPHSGSRGPCWCTLHLPPLLFSFHISFCHPDQIMFFIQLHFSSISFAPPPQVCTVKGCCKGGNPKQETCVNEEIRSGNGCSTLHCQTKDTLQKSAASFLLWGLAAFGPGTPIILSKCVHSG